MASEVSNVTDVTLSAANLNASTQIFQEIEKLEKEGKKVTRFSVTGYSLGGLLARYVVGCVANALVLTLGLMSCTGYSINANFLPQLLQSISTL